MINNDKQMKSDTGSSSTRVDETVGTAFFITNSSSFFERRVVV